LTVAVGGAGSAAPKVLACARAVTVADSLLYISCRATDAALVPQHLGAAERRRDRHRQSAPSHPAGLQQDY